jgi:pilus assembly protein CpaB
LRKLPLRTSKIYLLISLAAAVLAAVALLAYLHNMSSRIAESGRLVGLVVAARDLEAGEVLNPSSLSMVDFPDLYLLPGTFCDPLEITGNTLRHPIRAGEPLLESSLLAPQAGGLAQNTLDEGFRAYPLPSSAISFPAAELCEGSRVDILAVSKEGARPLLENIEVLGLSGRHSFTGTIGDDLPATASSAGECILLQITTEEACRLAAAQESGKVEVVLRPGRRR